jgi:signal transduction histidine kinase
MLSDFRRCSGFPFRHGVGDNDPLLNMYVGGKDMNVLVVDDEPVMLDSIRIALESNGHRVIGVRSPQQALHQLSYGAMPIGLVLTDYLMPGITGLELLEMIREKHKDLPVILMTAYSETALVIQALKHHCDGFIEKPFSPDQLLAEFDRIEQDRKRKAAGKDSAQDLPKIVHQINNPLLAITGYAQLIQMKGCNENGMQQYADKILDAVHQIQRINKKILQQPTIDNPAQHDPEEIGPVSLEERISDCLDFFDGIFTMRNIRVEIRISETGLQVMGNAFDIEQALKNLITNAIDAMAESTQKLLSISLAPTTDGRFLDLGVADTGCGIEEEFRDRIFETFFTRKPNGYGVGLAVVKQAIEKQGGSVFVESQPGKGSRFVIRLPLLEPKTESQWHNGDLAAARLSRSYLMDEEQSTDRFINNVATQ